MQPDPNVDVVLDAIRSVAPELDVGDFDLDADFLDDLDLDSMDQLNIAVAVHENTGIDILESDQAGLRTVNAFVAYLRSVTPSSD